MHSGNDTKCCKNAQNPEWLKFFLEVSERVASQKGEEHFGHSEQREIEPEDGGRTQGMENAPQHIVGNSCRVCKKVL